MSIIWNCQDNAFGRPSINWILINYRFRVLSMNWSRLLNGFRRLVNLLELSRQLISGAGPLFEISRQYISGVVR